ncbi:MAG: protein-glutamate O-methyltransferase CheR [Candidatus Methanomethyliaceae archaeon]|nr:protein-glutamate O-methyltransferase CheR [Candidatus Methanomethyliaceae archaeon]MDW7971488.1 protein-glutamate O-methyltransferase CheR [Nitrososphaerota archaeon]
MLEFEMKLLNKTLEKQGIFLPNFKTDFIIRRVQIRMMLTGCKNIIDYCNLLSNNPKEIKNLLECTFINVSEFFRDPPLWNKLREIIPIIKPMKIWSVGCSCGEEPYSLAILLLEAGIENAKIIATDIDEEALNLAIYGRYSDKEMNNVPTHILNKYFQKENDGFIISQKLKKIIKFIKHDITRDAPFLNCDMILCRNLLIYFSKEVQDIILKKLWHSLKEEGIFIIGMSEVLDSKWMSYFTPYDLKLRIYRKSNPLFQ